MFKVINYNELFNGVSSNEMWQDGPSNGGGSGRDLLYDIVKSTWRRHKTTIDIS